MQTMRRYSVGGQTLNVPASDNEEFMNTAASRGDQPDEIETYRVKGADGSVVTANVPRSQFGEFDALAASRGDVIDRVRRYRMFDGADVELSDSEAYNLVGRVARGREVSRKAWERAGLPPEYGKDAADRDAFGRMLAASPEFSDFAYTTYTDNFVKNGGKGEYVTRDAYMAQAERTLAELKDYVPTGSRGSQGFWSNRQQQATVNLGHEASALETVGEMLPFVRSGLNAQSRMNDGVVQDIANGRFPDKDTMSAAARQFMTDEQWNSIPWMSPNLWQHLPQIQQAAQTYMAPRNEAVARAQESLRQHETTTAQDVVGGAADLGATLVEMSTPYGIVTKGVENTVTNGGNALKGFGGAAAEYAIWSKLPGGGKVGRHLGGALGENAAQIANNVLKSKLTEFTNNVVGAAVPEGERQGFGEWAESFFDIPGNAKTFLEFAIIHAATKGIGAAAKRATAAGRDRLAQARETRDQIRKIFGRGTESHLTDEDVANLSRMVNSPSMTQKNLGRLVKSVGENLDVEKGREAVNAGRRADTAAERAKRPSAEQSARLDEVISEYAPGEEAKAAVRERVLKDIGGDKSVLDDPVELEKRVMGVLDKGGDDGIARSTNETGREVMGKIEREAERRRSARGAAERAERKAAEAEYEKAERERIEREKAEEAAVPEVGAETAAKEKSAAESRETAPEAPASNSPRMTEWPEYAEWLGKTGKADSHKNWNRFVAENELDPALKVKRDNKGKPVEPDYTRPATIKAGELSPEEIAAGEAEGRRIVDEAKKGLKRIGDRRPVEEAAPVPDGKGESVKPKAAESDYGVTMSEEPDVDGDGVWYVVKSGKSNANRVMYKSREKAEAVLSEERAFRKAIMESPSATLADGKKIRLVKTDEGWVPYDENYIDLRRGLFKAAKTKAEAVKIAEKGVRQAKDVAEFNSAYKRFGEDFGLDEFNEKVGWGNENGEGWNESAALEHMRRFDLEKLKDMKERAKRFNLGHHNGRDKKIQEWFDKVISEKKSPVPDGKVKMVKPELNKPETITLTENDGKTYEVALPKIEIKPFEKAKTKEEWLARQKEIGALVDEFKKKTPFHSVVNPKTGKYYESSSEAAKQRRREVFAYEEAVRRAADKAFKQVGEYNDSWDVESPKPAGARPVAETPEQFRERVKDDPVLRRLDAAQKRAKTPAERNAIADKFKARIEELRAQSPRDAATTPPQSGEKGSRSASAEIKPITQAASAEGREAVSEAPAATPKKLGDRKAPAATAAEGKKTTAKADGDIKELSKRLRSMKKTDNVPQELIDRMSKLSDRDLKKLEDEVAPMWTWANENVKRAIAYVRQMRGENEKLVSVGNLKPKTKSAAPEVKDRLAAEREAALSAADESIAKRLKEIGASKEDADRLLAAIKSGKTDGGSTTAEIAREIEKRLGDKASEKVEIPLGGKAKAVADSRLDNLVEVRSRLTHLGKEASKQYAQQTSAERQERLRSDPKVLEWARKNGREISPDGKVSPATVNDFQNESVKAAERMTRNLFREGNDVIIDKQTGRDYDPELDGSGGLKISKDGVTVGIYDPATRKVTLFRGADAETVYHELIGHAVEDYAKRNDATLYKKLQGLVSDAPAELVEDVRRLYPDANASTLSKEIIARVAQGKGLEALSSKNAPKNWLARAYVTVRDAIMDFLAKTGLRRIDTDRMQNMTPMEAMDYLMREIGRGKTLGRLGVADTTGRTSAGERWANRFFDRHTSLSKISKEAADAKALQPGREAEFQILKFNKKRDEYARLLRENDVTHETVADYMKTMAAKDRNDRLRREAMERGAEASEVRDDGSGLSPKEVQDRLDFYKSLDAERRQAIENVAKFLWKMQDEGLAERVRSGLLSEKEAQAFRDAEPNHAPLRSAIDPETGELVPWVGGKNMSSPEFRRAEGRFSEAGDVVAWMFEEYADAHLRAIENDTRRILADAIERNPALGTVYKGKVEEQRVRGGQGQANAVTFRTVNDKGESVRHTILLEGERGRLAASSYTGRDLVKPKWMEAGPTVWGHKLSLNNFMRFWSGTATEWSPTFALRNLIADNIDIAQITLAEKGFKEGGKWLGRYAKNRKSLAREVWEYARTGKVRDGSTLAEFVKAGGMIGGFEREGYNEIKDTFSYERMKKEFAKNPAKAVTGHVNNILKAINGYSELASRVASFKTDLADGMSAKEAALRARRITVDFNRKGNLTPVMNRLYMFSNSAIGATMRQLEAVRNGWKTAAGRRAIIGMAAYGVAEALAEYFTNTGDDENEKKGLAVGRDINEFTRKNSLYVRVGNRVFRLPAHDDPLMRLKYVANATTRFAMGSLSGEKWAKEVFGSALEDVPRFFGMGSRSFIDENRGGIIDPNIATWAPSGISWIFELRENRNYMGSPITKPKYDEALPDSWNGRESTPDVFQQMAKGLNELTGGNSGRSGVMDFAPETLQHVTSSLFKNAGRDTFMAIDVGLKLVTGEFREVEGNKTPYARDFRRKYDGNDNRYFENRRAYDKDETELKRRTKAKDFQPGERAEFFKEHPWLRMLPGGKSRVHNLNATIDRLRREERAAKTDERRAAVRERRMKLQATVNRIMEGRE